MGMFDTVMFKCPSCGVAAIEVQSRAGDCLLDNYWQGEVPGAVAADIVGETHCCDSCHKTWQVVSLGQVTTVPMGVVEV